MEKFNMRRFSAVWIVVASVASSSCASEDYAHKEQLAKAEAMMAELCKSSGEKIYKTVDNVESIYLLKVRPDKLDYGQFALSDPYGRDSTGEMYIKNFLYGFYHQNPAPDAVGAPPRIGFSFVDAVDEIDGKRYRYKAHPTEEKRLVSEKYGGDGKKSFIVKNFVLERILAPDPAPRYGVTYEDISTHQQREYWIAGSSLKVIDLEKNEVIAERVGYMMDEGQGSRAGARSPWLQAPNYACPGFQFNPNRPLTRSNGGAASAQPSQTLIFVEKVLHPAGYRP